MADDIIAKETDFHESVETNTSDIGGNIHVPGISSDSEDDQSTLDEPVSATLKRDMTAIGRKFLYVVFPRRNPSLLRDWDLWGPLILCVLMATLLQGSDDGAPQFAQVFAIVWLGSTVVTLNSKLLGGTISFFQSLCVLGYCVLPLAVALIICKLILLGNKSTSTATTITTLFAIRCIVVLGTLVWSCFASIGFLGDSQPLHRKPLAVYPICLFYFVISWMVLSHSG